MSRDCHLDNADTNSVVLNRNESENRIERKDSMKIRGVKVDQHLTWEEHVAIVIKPSFDGLQLMKLLKRETPYKLRKISAKALTLSQTDYANLIMVSKCSKIHLEKKHLEIVMIINYLTLNLMLTDVLMICL